MAMLHPREPLDAPITVSDDSFWRLLIMQVPAILWTVDCELRFTMANGAGLEALQLPPDARLGLSLAQYFRTNDADFPPVVAHRRALAGIAGSYEFEWHDHVFHCRVAPLRAADGEIIGVTGVGLDVTEQRRAVSVLAGQKQVLETLAEGLALPAVLDALAMFIEAQSDDTACAVFLRDGESRTLRLMAAPSLPRSFQTAVTTLAIGVAGGACGLAVETGYAVGSSDLSMDPMYEPWRGLIATSGLRACWSSPIVTRSGAVLGTFAMYYRQAREPTALDVQLAALATHLAGMAITHTQAEERLRRRNEELAALHDTALGLINQRDPDSLLEAILARATALLDTAHGYIYVTDIQPDTLIIRSGTGMFAHQLGYRLRRGSGLAGQVWDTGQPLIVDDYSTWSGRQVDLDRLAIRAVVGIPLWAGGVIVGVIGLAYEEASRPIPTEVLPLLTRFGQLASLALENARLYSAAQQEVADRTRAEARLAHLALHDPLTDLPNRSLLHERLTAALHTTQGPLALLVMDLDRFKDVNDTLGHYLGDLLLREVGMRLSGAVRPGALVARLGGDEFAVLLPHSDRPAAARVARKLLKVLERPFVLEGQHLDVRGSIGVAVSPAHGGDSTSLLRHADVAMYQAKRGRSGYAVYDAHDDPYSAERLALSSALRRAIEQDELVLYYQPKMSHQSRRITGVEALIRWAHPERGLLEPDQFLALAEHTGLIKELSHWVLTTALRQCRQWGDTGLSLPVAVNLSMGDLHDPHLPDVVARLLQTAGVAPGMLRVEITEGAAMADVSRTLAVLTQLRNSGVQLAVDDFGTGHSSLAQLQRLPLDQLKIDKTFVRDMTRNANDAAIVRSTIGLGHQLGLSVIAEGIEDHATWDLLTEWGCDEGQGYYLSRPLPAARVRAWVAQRTAG
ncbi:MAG TPA: EAL domain-containing protein [Chloroflexia bacterium]|nr:EAL domain-containing protein [Chloroflexia bacterium]